MNDQIYLDQRGTTILVGVFLALLALVFIAGWLTGLIARTPGAPPAAPPPPPPVKPAIKVAVPAPPPPVTDAGDYTVQVGAFATVEGARQEMAALELRGYRPYVFQGTNSKGEQWFTVRLGDYRELERAREAARIFSDANAAEAVVTFSDSLNLVRRGAASESAPAPAAAPQETPPVETDGDAAGKSVEEEGAASGGAPADVAGEATKEAATASGADAATEPEVDGIQDALDSDAGPAFEDDGPSGEAAETGAVSGERPKADDAAAVSEAAASPEAGEETAPAMETDQGIEADGETGQAEAEAVPAVADAAADTPPGPTGEVRYVVQAGTFREPENAERLVARLHEQGRADAYLFEETDTDAAPWYVVRFGFTDDVDAARSAAARYRTETGAPALVIQTRTLPPDALSIEPPAPSAASPAESPGPSAALPTEAPDPAAELLEVLAGAPADAARYPYTLHLADFAATDAARQATERFRRQGLAAYHVAVAGEQGDPRYRVLAGAYADRDRAETAQQAAGLADSHIRWTPWANQVGIDMPLASMGAAVRRLEDAGYAPYAVPVGSGRHRLLVGAFDTRAAAVAHRRRLAADGFAAEVVLR